MLLLNNQLIKHSPPLEMATEMLYSFNHLRAFRPLRTLAALNMQLHLLLAASLSCKLLLQCH